MVPVLQSMKFYVNATVELLDHWSCIVEIRSLSTVTTRIGQTQGSRLLFFVAHREPLSVPVPYCIHGC
jgi:hypothetical protein